MLSLPLIPRNLCKIKMCCNQNSNLSWNLLLCQFYRVLVISPWWLPPSNIKIVSNLIDQILSFPLDRLNSVGPNSYSNHKICCSINLECVAIACCSYCEPCLWFFFVTFVGAFLLCSVVPLLGDSLSVLMQRQPKELDNILPGCYQRVRDLIMKLIYQHPYLI